MSAIPNGSAIGIFLFVTVILGGGAAWMAGTGLARAWSPFWRCALALLLIAGVTRFLHYALFAGDLLSIPGYALDAAVILLVGGGAYRFTRAGQMTTQYRWLYVRAGPLGWRARDPSADPPG